MKFVYFLKGCGPSSKQTIICNRVYDFKNSICVETDNELYHFKWEELGDFRIYD